MSAAATPSVPAPGAARTSEPLLDVRDIQGNILAGFSKDHQLLAAFSFRDTGTAKTWLRRIVHDINSVEEVYQFNSLFKLRRLRLGIDPPGLIATWANIVFSHDGLAQLTSRASADGVPDEAFRVGLPPRAASLGDPAPANGGDPTLAWVVGRTEHVPDALLIIASDAPSSLKAAAGRLYPNQSDGPNPPELVWEELGETRSDLPGHEHFGFKDGVSQPGIRGLISSKPDVFLTPQFIAASAANSLPCDSPGQALVWPGQFVFGYPSCDGSSGSSGGSVVAAPLNPPWVKNGSLLVFRRLRQNVSRFHSFMREEAVSIARMQSFAQMTPEQLGALIVGRWASGAPISRTPDKDLIELAKVALANNDFRFVSASQKPDFLPGVPGLTQSFPLAPADPHGFICPHAAHIRKVNPRDQDSDKGDQFDTLTRRILRRGIPYGPPLANSQVDDGIDRGLHFLCYQTSIVDQFETLQSDWANSDQFPQPGGHDAIIGQPVPGTKSFTIFRTDGTSQSVSVPDGLVTATGGGYFFSPAISAIRDTLARS